VFPLRYGLNAYVFILLNVSLYSLLITVDLQLWRPLDGQNVEVSISETNLGHGSNLHCCFYFL
jgi:hypothetical protein